MRVCKKCGEDKPETEFYMYKSRGKPYPRPYCKACDRAKAARYVREHREERVAYNREYVKANPHKIRGYKRKGWLKWKYQLTTEEYAEMLDKQAGGCAICGEASQIAGTLHVDHDHSDGHVRGLLCNRCNQGIGYLRDHPTLLAIASAYVANA